MKVILSIILLISAPLLSVELGFGKIFFVSIKGEKMTVSVSNINSERPSFYIKSLIEKDCKYEIKGEVLGINEGDTVKLLLGEIKEGKKEGKIIKVVKELHSQGDSISFSIKKKKNLCLITQSERHSVSTARYIRVSDKEDEL